MHTSFSAIQRDMHNALRNREEARLSTLRMLVASLKNRSIEKRGKGESEDLTEEEVARVIRSEVKKRRDAAGEFARGGRADLAEKETWESRILESYVPPDASEEEIKNIVQGVVGQTRAASEKDFGRIMGQVMGRIKGRASGERVAEIVKQMLAH